MNDERQSIVLTINAKDLIFPSFFGGFVSIYDFEAIFLSNPRHLRIKSGVLQLKFFYDDFEKKRFTNKRD